MYETNAKMLRQGQKKEMWSKFCGFLDLQMNEFMDIQERLLFEQFDLLKGSKLAEKFIGPRMPKSIEEFRNMVPVTTYEDYEEYFELKREDVLPQPAYGWARTSGRSGKMKWIPYTRQSYERFGERVLAGVILATARYKGDINFAEHDTLIYNTPPRPYVSGVALRALSEHFNFKFIPPLETTESMQFQERIVKGFDSALVEGIDILGSLSVVLVKMGERFAEGAQKTKLSMKMLHPKVILRLARGFIRSKMEKRSMLPKDLWKVKGIPSGGMDTSIYKDKIAYYWGVTPYDQYGSTEEGAIAAQSWTKKTMTFFPDAAFLEFIPEDEWAIWRTDHSYRPKTVLLNEVKPQKRYELVITNFYGKPLLRYRLHDLFMINALEDPETGIRLPQASFLGRSNDFIDLAGFTGLIDEKMIWRSILNTGIEYEEWSIRKETQDGHPILHLYFEPVNGVNSSTVQKKVHECLKLLNPYYADYEKMIEKESLKVTILAHGTYSGYTKDMSAAGADLAHLKPPHMNPTDQTVEHLLEINRRISVGVQDSI